MFNKIKIFLIFITFLLLGTYLTISFIFYFDKISPEQNYINKEINNTIEEEVKNKNENKKKENNNLNLSNPEIDRLNYTIGDGKNLKIGLISDNHIDSDLENIYSKIKRKNLKRALTTLKDNKVQVIIITGDLVNSVKDEYYEEWLKIYNEVYEKSEKPILILTMGHSDYNINLIGNKEKISREKFKQFFNQSTFGNIIINNYHFIKYGNLEFENEKKVTGEKFLEEEIKKTINLSKEKNKPIFIISHLNILNTVYGSEKKGQTKIKEILNKYNQIIFISGHSHYPLIDERSIHQKNFTSIQLQSTSFIKIEENYENEVEDELGNNLTSYLNPMGIIMNINETQILIQRVFLLENKIYNYNWIIKNPIFKSDFLYEENKRNLNIDSPYFDNNYNQINFYESEDNNLGKVKFVSFKQAKHKFFIHSYLLIFENDIFKTELKYISDFYLFEKDRKDIITLRIKKLFDKGKYNLKIYAIDCFNQLSNNYLTTNVDF